MDVVPDEKNHWSSKKGLKNLGEEFLLQIEFTSKGKHHKKNVAVYTVSPLELPPSHLSIHPTAKYFFCIYLFTFFYIFY